MKIVTISTNVSCPLPDEFSYGGMSVCPTFVNREGRFDFTVVIYEASGDKDDIFYISHVDFLKSTDENRLERCATCTDLLKSAQATK